MIIEREKDRGRERERERKTETETETDFYHLKKLKQFVLKRNA